MTDSAARRIGEAHRRSKASAVLTVGWAVVAGVELSRVKASFSHGENNLRDWLKAECPEISLATAYRYIALARDIKKRASGRLLELLTSEPVDPAGREEILCLIAKVADGATITELYQEYGIVKRPPGSAVAGGYQPDAGKLREFAGAYHPELAGTRYEALPADVQGHFRKWAAQKVNDPAQLAFDWCKPVFDAFEHPFFESTVQALLIQEKRRLLDHAEALVRQLREDIRQASRAAA